MKPAAMENTGRLPMIAYWAAARAVGDKFFNGLIATLFERMDKRTSSWADQSRKFIKRVRLLGRGGYSERINREVPNKRTRPGLASICMTRLKGPFSGWGGGFFVPMGFIDVGLGSNQLSGELRASVL